ncbi:MAG: hypothetical protein ABR915_11865 [Thermoguttaceae bacterium]
MRRNLLRLTDGAIACLLLCRLAMGAEATPAPRVEPAKPSAAEAREPVAGGVDEAQPSIYYLKDQQGKLQPVVNFTLSDFEKAWKLLHQLADGDQRPRYSLQQMSASGTLSGDFAELSVQFRILVREEQWTRVPLRLDQGRLREPAQCQGSGEQFVEYEGAGAGYVAWIRGPAGQQHQITLKMLVPVATVGEVTRLHLRVPRATASELRLKVPLVGAVAKVSEGATLRTPSSTKNETEFTVAGLSGDFELSWRRPDARVAEAPTVLEAQGALSARLDNRGVDAEATLAVRSYGSTFDSFRVRLPQEAELVPGAPNGYAVMPVESTGPPGSRQRVVEVRLAKQTTGPVEVHLATNRAMDTTKPGPWVELAGFEVIGAARQWGTIAVSVVGDWQILWGPSAGVQQSDLLPESARRKDMVAAFDYFSQAYSLSARLVPRKTRISVEPEYLLSVDADAVRLDAKLRYTVRGAKVFAVDVAMPDWQIDDISPDSLVAVDGVPKGAVGGTISIPLIQASAGQFEVRLRAHRPLAADARSLVVPLPQAQSSAPASAVLVVLPADNVELIPGGDAMTGLFRQQGTIPMELPSRQQEPLFYRSESSAVFAAEVRRHSRQISVDVASQVELDAHGGRVEQKLAYLISYEPTDRLTLEVPRRLAESGRLELKYDNQTVVPIAADEQSKDVSKPVRMRVLLPKAAIGLCELSARYRLPPQEFSQDKRDVVVVPLVMPGEGNLLSNRLGVSAAAELHVESRPGPWTAVEAGVPRPDQQQSLRLAAAGPSDQVALEVEGLSGGETALVVERAWVQTWLTKTARQDRAVFQFTTSRRQLEVALPAAVDQISVVLDGKRLAAAVTGENTVVLPLAGDGPAGRHVADLRYHSSDSRPPRGAMTIELPHPRNDAWVRQMYWQLVLPRDEHVVVSPGDCTDESTWGWRDCYWGRKPLLDEAELEDWAGLSHSARDIESGGANYYLFSTLGAVSPLELRTASRSAIVLAASGAVLLAGLVLLYWPRTRHPASLLTATVGLAAVAAVLPDAALLGAQAAVLGLVLALLAGLLSHILGRRRRMAPLVEPASSVIGSSALTTHTPLPAAAAAPAPAAAGSPAPASAAPPSTSLIPPESQP